MTKRLVIIDGKSVFYRGYYAMPHLSTSDGTPTGGVYGFAALSIELIKKLQPDYVCVAWDKPKTNIRKRLEMYPEYKAGRKPAPADFYAQIPLLHDLLDALGWPLYELDDYEADDIMGSLAVQASEAGIETCLISSDLDLLQCVGPLTHVYALKKGLTNIDLFDPAFFEEKYGIRVDQFVDLKALKGDSSDNIPGVAGIGEKGGVALLSQYGTLDGIYENIDAITGATQKKLIAGKEMAYLSKKLAQIWTDAPISLDLDAMNITKLDTARLRQTLEKLEFASLIRTIPEYMSVDTVAATPSVKPLKMVEWSDEQRTRSLMAEAVVVFSVHDAWYIASDDAHISSVAFADIAESLAHVRIVTHDGNVLCKALLQAGVKTPETLYDTRQAGFLLNPLKRSHSLEEATGYDGDEPAVIAAHLWKLYRAQLEQFDTMPGVYKVATELDFPLISLLARMEYRGIRLDVDFLDTMNTDLTREIDSLRMKIYELVGEEFNISSPSQLAHVLFDTLALPTTGVKKGKTGYSTGQKELDKLRGLHPIIELIESYRELTKLQNTYVESLPKLVDEQGHLHTTFNQDVAATGRLSSTDPNLQNIPIRTPLGRKIREAFVPRDGYVFVSADYSQFELRLAAVLAGDQPMIDAFNEGIDIHTKTASDVHGVALEAVTKDQRRDAKVINFGVLYGMSPHGLAAQTNMSFMQAKEFIDEYFRQRAPIRSYIDATIRRAKEAGYVETLYGRRRPTPDVLSSNFMVRSGAERAAANMPIQGTEADLMKKAMLEVEKKLNEGDEPLGYQLLQIHDSILIECPREHAEHVCELVKTTMEGIAPDLGIRLDVDVSMGDTWGAV